jgi:nitroreductase
MAVSSSELTRFLRRLRAVREFTSEPVSDEAIQDILEVGRWSGSGSNKQPCEVLVIRDREAQSKFGEWGARPAETAGVVFLIVSRPEANPFDEGRMAERLLLGAAAHGLGSTVAFLKGEGPAAAKQQFGIPDDQRAIVVVAVGHTDVEARKARQANPQARKPMEEYAHWNRF